MARPPPPASLYANEIPFAYFATLVDRVGTVAAKKKGGARSSTVGKSPKEHRLLAAWIDGVRAEHRDGAVPEGTIVLFFRLFFPDEGIRRRYGLQELTLGEALESVYGAKRGSFSRWNAAASTSAAAGEGSGCMGLEVARWLERRGKWGKGKVKELTMGRVDELLDELATLSDWSSADIKHLRMYPRYTARPVTAILADLLLPLSPSETAVMLQIILRDLSPLLYPPPSALGDVALTRFTSLAYNELGLYDAMRLWHEGMPRLYQAVADLDWVAWQAEKALRHGRPLGPVVPKIGLPIKVPKTEKPGSCSRATRHLEGEVAVETKYDGERLQIHIDLGLPPLEQIRIFSKSGRDSTDTRHLLLPIIRASLDLPLDPLSRAMHPLLYDRLLASASSRAPTAFPPSRLILEGEMVPYDESRSRIDEFWKLAFAKGGAALPAGVAGTPFERPPGKDDRQETQETGGTGATPSPRRSRRLVERDGDEEGERDEEEAAAKDDPARNLHLMVVWFDVLLLDDESLLDETYSSRRARLDSLIRPIPGFSMLSERVLINFDHKSSALENLRLRFAHIITRRCEGLMLKPLGSLYNDPRPHQRIVKLKKDFVPGAGDTLDFHVVGASWQKQRGRELLVPTTVYTTFFIGLREDKFGVNFSRERKPHYHILFSVSYGLSRTQLAQLCLEIDQNRPEHFDLAFGKDAERGAAFRPVKERQRWRGGVRGGYTVYGAACTSFTFSLAGHMRSAATRPSIIFREPRIMELNGAGFQRSIGCPYYELRFPRITKPSREADSGASPLSLDKLQLVAQEAVGAAPSTAVALVDDIWNAAVRDAAVGSSLERDTSSGEESQERYEREVRQWVERLEAADGVLDGERSVTDGHKRQGDEVRREEKRPRIDKAPAATSSTRSTPPLPTISTTRQASVDVDLSRTPTAASPPPPALSALVRSISSPSARSSAPSPSQRPFSLALEHPATVKKRAPLTSTVSCPSLSSKRRRRSSGSTRTSLTSTISTLLPALSPSSSLSSATTAAATTHPSRAFAWSLHPPLPPGSPLPTPRHPFLDSTNFLASPLSVLWVAGRCPASFSASSGAAGSTPAAGGPARQGFVFVAPGSRVERECVAWLEGEAEKGAGAERSEGRTTQVVWVVKDEALETRGMWDLGMGGEVLTVL
ncbi:uncharacterized protein RHOBADRAFT_53505 [Rhodotorula graminis WP1]|uniref:ATP-dependent DNA ligase family profile domain-containing protein n=1 Tax=Rhodotorula graminis (strain WP1) TaxID=578459 RepID=A0A194S481_RHOGW|nr:uncharacterized protein RHOBADRAFT_53505 [Rhodotorula graminis WP1]KPV75538.1 hypothetical protein RHOBADRAFT_53505 [Rhodotorula graminis WP1]